MGHMALAQKQVVSILFVCVCFVVVVVVVCCCCCCFVLFLFCFVLFKQLLRVVICKPKSNCILHLSLFFLNIFFLEVLLFNCL